MTPEELAKEKLQQSRNTGEIKQARKQKSIDNKQAHNIYAGFNATTGQPLTRSLGGEIVIDGKIITNGNLTPGDGVKKRGNTVDGFSRGIKPIPETPLGTSKTSVTILYKVTETRDTALDCVCPTWAKSCGRCYQVCDGSGYATLEECLNAPYESGGVGGNVTFSGGDLRPYAYLSEFESLLASCSLTTTTFNQFYNQTVFTLNENISTVTVSLEGHKAVTEDTDTWFIQNYISNVVIPIMGIEIIDISYNISFTCSRSDILLQVYLGNVPNVMGTNKDPLYSRIEQGYGSINLSDSETIDTNCGIGMNPAKLGIMFHTPSQPEPDTGFTLNFEGSITASFRAKTRALDSNYPSKETDIYYLSTSNGRVTKLAEFTSDEVIEIYLTNNIPVIKAGREPSGEWCNIITKEVYENPDPPTVDTRNWQKDWAYSYDEEDPESGKTCVNEAKGNNSNIVGGYLIECDLEQDIGGLELQEKIKQSDATAKFTTTKIINGVNSCIKSTPKTEKIKLKKLTRLSGETELDPNKTEVLAISVYYKE